MGRKPHPLVSRYFERGQKLSDSSNRYPHTCRRCGTIYPKGRNDTLLGHITKRCQAMSDNEKWAVHQQVAPRSGGSSSAGGGDVGGVMEDDEVQVLGEQPRHVSPGTAARLAQQQQQQHHHLGRLDGEGHDDCHDSDDIMMLDESEGSQHAVAGGGGGGGAAAAAAGHPEDPDQAAASSESRNWSALEALAEASRQVDMSEKHDHPAAEEQQQQQQQHGEDQATALSPEIERPISEEGGAAEGGEAPKDFSSNEARLIELLRMDNFIAPPPAHASEGGLNAQAVAVAATRLSPSLLRSPPTPHTPLALPPTQEPPVTVSPPPVSLHMTIPNMTGASTPTSQSPAPSSAAAPKPASAAAAAGQDSWGPIAYKPILPNGRTALPLPPPSRGGQKIDVSAYPSTASSSSSSTVKHLRAKFSPGRRKEVQEVRKMGACIRCKLLRKTCGPDTPCSACCRVLAPRVWTTGCVRTKLSDQVELWSAGLQTLLVTNQINQWKKVLDYRLHTGPAVVMALDLEKDQSALSGSGFGASSRNRNRNNQPHLTHRLRLGTLVGPYARLHNCPDDGSGRMAPVMLDYETQDVGDAVESYMQQILPSLIAHEPQTFTRTVLEAAHRMLAEQEDEMLRKALDLWGLAELVDRETCWHMAIQPASASVTPASSASAPPSPVQILTRDRISGGSADDDNNNENEGSSSDPSSPSGANIYGMFSMQLSAAAERRANMTSKSLLSSMQRILFDSKVKIGFPAYLACLVFVIAIEKEIWMFKAWEAPRLIQSWPLARSPEQYAAQVRAFPGVLRMILSVRRVFPRTARDPRGKLVVEEGVPAVDEFFQLLDLNYDTVLERHNTFEIDNSNSRSIEMHLASHLLLPESALQAADSA